MSDKSLVEVMREYVRENHPHNGAVAEISGKEWTFIFNAESDALRRGRNYVFARKMDITSLEGISHIINAVFLDDVTFSNINFKNNFTLYIEAADTATIMFAHCHIASKFKIRNPELEYANYEEALHNKVKVHRIMFGGCSIASNATGKLPYFRVGFLDADVFLLENLRVPNDAEVNIGDCRFNHFGMSNVRNLGKLKLYRINTLENETTNDGVFRLDNTSIGDADFQSVDLSSFAACVIFDNILVGLKYSNVVFGQNDDEIEVRQFNNNELYKAIKKRDTYRVLKNVALNNNDNALALSFYAKEMEWHRQAVKLTDKPLLLDQIILAFNCWTSNFGQNWLRPLVGILGLGVVCYAGLLHSLCLSGFDWNNWAKFFLFLSPLHETEFIKNGDWGFWAYTIDFGFRVLEGSLIYQAIQAFRRYTRNI